MTTIYTLGYGHLSQVQIVAIAEEYEADIWDIRWNPVSRKPGFGRNQLAGVFGYRYRHLPSFGNRNYRGGPVEIANYAEGRGELLAMSRPVILLCVCPDPKDCHRTVVAKLLRAEGHHVTELSGKKKPVTQPPLFF